MNANLHNLFGLSDYGGQKTPDQKEFEKNNMEFLVTFKSIVVDSFEKMHTNIFSLFKPTDMDRNLPSVSMISFIRQGIIKHFPMFVERQHEKGFD